MPTSAAFAYFGIFKLTTQGKIMHILEKMKAVIRSDMTNREKAEKLIMLQTEAILENPQNYFNTVGLVAPCVQYLDDEE